jgi:predicted dehydrogenase
MARAYMHAIDLMRLDRKVEVVAACDVNEEKRAFVVEDLRIPRFTTRFEEIVQSPDVELVLITTSMPEHGPIATAALEAGKHVLTEKPMAVTLDEAAHLVQLASGSPGHLVSAPHVILSKTYQTIWRRVQRGDIGKVMLARGRYGWAGPTWQGWFYRACGGAIFDLAVYNITSLTGWLGPVKRVTAMAGTAVPERRAGGEKIEMQVEDNAHILLDFGEAVFAAVSTGFTIQRYRGPGLELYGSKGTIQMLGDDWDPNGYELWLNEVGAWLVYDESDPAWLWTDGLRHLVDCIRTGETPLITPEHAYHVLEVMIRAKESAVDGQARSIESSFPALAIADEVEAMPAHLIHDRSHPMGRGAEHSKDDS